jgi:hypothetical protein
VTHDFCFFFWRGGAGELVREGIGKGDGKGKEDGKRKRGGEGKKGREEEKEIWRKTSRKEVERGEQTGNGRGLEGKERKEKEERERVEGER